jgi:hypothetical protein
MSRRAGYLILAAVALEANLPQLIVQGSFKAFGIDLPVPDTPHWVSVSFAGLAVLLLIADRYLPETHGTPPPNPHDVQLFNSFRELFDDNVMYFLRTHDFGNGFDRFFFTRLNDVSAAWVGARYEFEDPELRATWDRLFACNRTLVRLMARNTTPLGSNPEWCKCWWSDEDELPERAEKAIKEMNETASELVRVIDELESLARAKLLSERPRTSIPDRPVP